jgi:hypothetical protein
MDYMQLTKVRDKCKIHVTKMKNYWYHSLKTIQMTDVTVNSVAYYTRP